MAREHGVPDRDGATFDRWSIDHLFVDQDAVPTLVEVKRSSDTRIRREVVGLMLDYAANGVLYWPVDRLREAFVATQRSTADDPDRAARDLTGDEEQDADTFFDQVHENLQSGRVRLVFVADSIPDELQRIVEFLNNQMNPAEVFAVEVKQYAAQGFTGRTIVPRVVGRTANSMTKQGSAKVLLTPQEYRERADPNTLDVADKLAAWARQHGLELVETRQARTAVRPDRSVVARISYSYAGLDIDMTIVRTRLGDARTDELMARLQGLTTRPLTTKWPSLPSADAAQHWTRTVGILEELL